MMLRIAFKATQEVLANVPETTQSEFEAAVQSARDAFPAWASKPLSERSRVMFKLLSLIQEEKVSCNDT